MSSARKRTVTKKTTGNPTRSLKPFVIYDDDGSKLVITVTRLKRDFKIKNDDDANFLFEHLKSFNKHHSLTITDYEELTPSYVRNEIINA